MSSVSTDVMIYSLLFLYHILLFNFTVKQFYSSCFHCYANDINFPYRWSIKVRLIIIIEAEIARRIYIQHYMEYWNDLQLYTNTTNLDWITVQQQMNMYVDISWFQDENKHYYISVYRACTPVGAFNSYSHLISHIHDHTQCSEMLFDDSLYYNT